MTLYEELTQGPLAAELAPLLAAKEYGKVADVLNRQDIPAGPGLVSRTDLRIWAARTGMRAVIQDHADNVDSPMRSIALSILDVFQNPVDGIDLGDPAIAAMLGEWAAEGSLPEPARADLLALSERQVSRAGRIGLHVDFQTVADAIR